eukprot:2132429-Amphidinium_carterae.1
MVAEHDSDNTEQNHSVNNDIKNAVYDSDIFKRSPRLAWTTLRTLVVLLHQEERPMVSTCSIPNQQQQTREPPTQFEGNNQNDPTSSATTT